MFLDSDFQRKMVGQCQQEAEQQQEKSGALEKMTIDWPNPCCVEGHQSQTRYSISFL
jgi:hypothetical protein